MSTKLSAALLVLFTTLLTSSGQILYKLGSATLEFNIASVLTNYYIIIGLIVYAIGGVLIIVALKGGEVSVLYPIIATSYIWVSWLSIFFLNERMNAFKWFGVTFIIFGIISIGFGSKESTGAEVL